MRRDPFKAANMRLLDAKVAVNAAETAISAAGSALSSALDELWDAIDALDRLHNPPEWEE